MRGNAGGSSEPLLDYSGDCNRSCSRVWHDLHAQNGMHEKRAAYFDCANLVGVRCVPMSAR